LPTTMIKKTIQSTTALIITFIAIFGGIWTLIESAGFFFESSFGAYVKKWNDGLGFWVIVVISLVASFITTYSSNIYVFIKAILSKRKPVKILVIRARPKWLMEMLRRTGEVAKTRNYPELKPEYVSDVETDDKIVKRVFSERESRNECTIKILNPATKSDVAEALLEKWDIVHFDCVIASPNARLCLDDGMIEAHAMREILKDKEIRLLVLMDCDSLQIALTTKAIGVENMIAITRSLPVLAGERFTQGLYGAIEKGLSLDKSFQAGKQLASTEIERDYVEQLFVFEGNSEFEFFKSINTA